MSRPNALERQMLTLINQERAEVGLNPLRFNGRLNDASEDHSRWMLNVDRFSHTGAGGSTAGDRIVDAGYQLKGNWAYGENIGWQSLRGAPGARDDVRGVHEALMNSPGHRANILNPTYKEIGIGIELGAFTTGRATWDAIMVTQNFARTSATTAAKVAAVAETAPAPAPVQKAPPVQPTPAEVVQPQPAQADLDRLMDRIFAAFEDGHATVSTGFTHTTVTSRSDGDTTVTTRVVERGDSGPQHADLSDLADSFRFDTPAQTDIGATLDRIMAGAAADANDALPQAHLFDMI